MIKRDSIYIDFDYVFIVLLLVFSGNPITRFISQYTLIFISLLILIARYGRIRKDFYVTFFSIAGALLLLFILQNIVLEYVSWPGAINYIMKFFFGGIILYLVSDRFVYKLFVTVFYISLISLVLYPFINVLRIHPPGLVWEPGGVTYGIYTYVSFHNLRNCAMFWEPGAFAGVLTLCIALNLNQLPFLWKEHRLKVVVILLALLTTQSTTGYLVLFFIGFYYLVFVLRSRVVQYILLPGLFVVGVVVYENTSFLKDKIEHQTEVTSDLDKNEYTASRFGALLFDLHYIKKHPMIGNGFHESTRFADNPELIQLIKFGQNLAHGNGFSNYIACLGIPFMIIYLLVSYKAISSIDKKTAFLVVIVIVLLQMGEQWLSHPLFLSMVFINNKKPEV